MDEIIRDCWAKGFGFHQTWEIVRRETGKTLSKAVWEKEQRRHHEKMMAFFEMEAKQYSADTLKGVVMN